MATTHRTVAAGDVELVIDEAGNGGRPLVLVHGFTGARTDFDMVLDDLAARGWHAVAPDLRGHGDSTQPSDERAYSLDLLSADVLALADGLGFERFAILGHSMGGMVAQTVILRAPERIDVVVLMDTSHGPVEIDPATIEVAAMIARTQGIDAIADFMAATSGPLETDAYRRAVEADPSYGVRGDRNRRVSSSAMFAAMATELTSQPDRLDDLASLTVPTLVIVGEEDTPFLPASRRMADTIPGACLAVIPGAGHSPQFEAPADWWSALSTFLDDLPPSDR